MQAYIYHLKNIITDKEYIGCAINFETRLEKHLSHLRLGKHHSWKLQQAYKDYGWESFTTSFIIVSCKDLNELYKYEIKEIAKYNSYYDGYNCSLGGEGHKTVFTYDESVLIYQICQRYEGVYRQMARYFHCDASVFSSIAKNSIYDEEIYDEYLLDKLINDIGLSVENLKENYIKHNNRKLNRQQCYEYIAVISNVKNSEKIMSRQFNIASITAKRILDGKAYQDYYLDFLKLSDEEKVKILEETLSKYNVYEILASYKRKGVKNPLTQDDVNFILSNLEKTNVEIAERLNISEDRVSSIRNGKSYKDYIKNYYSQQD